MAIDKPQPRRRKPWWRRRLSDAGDVAEGVADLDGCSGCFDLSCAPVIVIGLGLPAALLLLR